MGAIDNARARLAQDKLDIAASDAASGERSAALHAEAEAHADKCAW